MAYVSALLFLLFIVLLVRTYASIPPARRQRLSEIATDNNKSLEEKERLIAFYKWQKDWNNLSRVGLYSIAAAISAALTVVFALGTLGIAILVAIGVLLLMRRRKSTPVN